MLTACIVQGAHSSCSLTRQELMGCSPGWMPATAATQGLHRHQLTGSLLVLFVLLLLRRVSWAGLELRAGNLDVCRQLLREGLDQHPDFPAALLMVARAERLSGNLVLAEAFARRAQKVCGMSCCAALCCAVVWCAFVVVTALFRECESSTCRRDSEQHAVRTGFGQCCCCVGSSCVASLPLPSAPVRLCTHTCHLTAASHLGVGCCHCCCCCHRAACQADAFAVAAMRELQQIYRAKGERALASNLSRHIHITESRNANKKAGKVHGSTAWEAMMTDVRSSEQRELVSAARERKVALGIIRPRPLQQGDAWQAGQQQHQQPQQQPRAQQQERQRRGHSRQQTQAVQQEPDSLAGFDFAAAVQAVQSEAATAHRMPGRRRRQVLQQQLDQPPE